MDKADCENSVGIVKPEEYTFAEGLKLECGRSLAPITLRYETYGKLSENADNAILIEHALTGDAHVAGKHSPDDKKPGWWDEMVGPWKPFDTLKYFIVCSNVIGGCSGSTGPCSINPATGTPYNIDFPVITVGDMVEAQKKLMEHLGIKKWLCVAGGSAGGMQAIQWSAAHPEMVGSLIAIATSARFSTQAIAFDWVGREAILHDAAWNGGNYKEQPENGLATARMLAHITYLSAQSMNNKFGRKLQDSDDYSFGFKKDFRVESYLEHQGERFVGRFDANSYLYMTRATDYFDVASKFGGSLEKAFQNTKMPYLVVSFTSDWLFPPYQSKELARALLKNRAPVTYCEIQSDYGHDAFLLETETLGKIIRNFLKNV